MNNTNRIDLCNNNYYTLIINYPGLKIGGIEVYFANLIRYAMKKNYRVIWLTTKNAIEQASYRDLVESEKLEKIIIGVERKLFKKVSIPFEENEKVIMLSCEPLYFIAGESIRKKANVEKFAHYLVLPHYTGNAYYIERYFSWNILKNYCYRFMRKIIIQWERTDCILAFSKIHLDAYEKNYDLKISNKDEKVLKSLDDKLPFDDHQVWERARNRKSNFVIMTCARFDFPHKGYIIGLIQTFAKLKESYPWIRLVIVGYGQDEQKVKDEISKLSKVIQKDIVLTGALQPKGLQKQFELATLNVGLAGALIQGAECGIPSLQVRHYIYECQGYGFLGEVDDTSPEEPGESIEKYIVEAIEMSDEEYYNKSKLAYDRAYLGRTYEPDFLFNKLNAASQYGSSIKGKERTIAKMINFCIWYMCRFRNVRSYDN